MEDFVENQERELRATRFELIYNEVGLSDDKRDYYDRAWLVGRVNTRYQAWQFDGKDEHWDIVEAGERVLAFLDEKLWEGQLIDLTEAVRDFRSLAGFPSADKVAA